LTDYGAFVEVEPGIEGLVHVSEMDWTNKNIHPGKIAQLGDEVEVMILEIDEERRRLSLGMKQCKPNPWDDFSATHHKGDKVTGQIKSITDFGVFIGLPGGIDGLVHLSDLSWTQTGEEAIRNFKKGDELNAVILAIDVEKERISLGVKQLTEDPSGASPSASSSEDKSAKPKAKPAKTKAEAPSAEDAAAASGTTNLGALLKAKMDSKK
jgi:small subunit ribosomal protein S1